MQNLRFTSLLSTAALMTPLLVGPVQAQVISPSRGVVCDQRGQVCYDSQGLSMALTQEYFGNLAVQNAMTQIGSGPAPQDFRLSTGVACSSQARTCWSDGWSRNVIDWQLTSQLYNRNVNEGTGGGAASPERAGGVCNLNRSGQQLFSGSCQLKKISKANKTRFEAVLGNG